MANQEHLEILKRGVETWKQWRHEHPGFAVYSLLVLVTGGIVGLFGWMSGVRRGWTLGATILFTLGCVALGTLMMYYYQAVFLQVW
jgi:hypothetical protein